ncbi:unnamed protein product [Paramecium sonneborni]|uniref:Uncharacterized protein n=1 Tax=Paramecium sonneborni TaxID=65129 RepID=A0A8S1RLN2_9CILI|nr:unnamed protein product [Paramecium sonneborni]
MLSIKKQFSHNLLIVFELVDPQKEQFLQEKYRRVAETKIKFKQQNNNIIRRQRKKSQLKKPKIKKEEKLPATKPKDTKKYYQENIYLVSIKIRRE